jgi:hypothetical protein
MQTGFNTLTPEQQFTAMILTGVVFWLSSALNIHVESLFLYLALVIGGLLIAPRFTFLVIVNGLIVIAASAWYWPWWLALLLVYFVCFSFTGFLSECDDPENTISKGVLLGLLALGIPHFFDISLYHLHVTWHDYIILIATGVLATAVADKETESIILNFLLSIAIFYYYCAIFSPEFFMYIGDSFNYLVLNFKNIKIVSLVLFFAPILLILGYKKITDNYKPQSFGTKLSKLLIILLMCFCVVFWSVQFFGKAGAGLSMIACTLFVLYQILREIVYFVKSF